jgi:hypothetical protein
VLLSNQFTLVNLDEFKTPKTAPSQQPTLSKQTLTQNNSESPELKALFTHMTARLDNNQAIA